MKVKVEVVKVSKCCNYEVRYNGFVGLTDYGYTCNRCDRKCTTVLEKPNLINKNTKNLNKDEY